jgi:hypothetical protein
MASANVNRDRPKIVSVGEHQENGLRLPKLTNTGISATMFQLTNPVIHMEIVSVNEHRDRPEIVQLKNMR